MQITIIWICHNKHCSKIEVVYIQSVNYAVQGRLDSPFSCLANTQCSLEFLNESRLMREMTHDSAVLCWLEELSISTHNSSFTIAVRTFHGTLYIKIDVCIRNCRGLFVPVVVFDFLWRLLLLSFFGISFPTTVFSSKRLKSRLWSWRNFFLVGTTALRNNFRLIRERKQPADIDQRNVSSLKLANCSFHRSITAEGTVFMLRTNCSANRKWINTT